MLHSTGDELGGWIFEEEIEADECAKLHPKRGREGGVIGGLRVIEAVGAERKDVHLVVSGQNPALLIQCHRRVVHVPSIAGTARPSAWLQVHHTNDKHERGVLGDARGGAEGRARTAHVLACPAQHRPCFGDLLAVLSVTLSRHLTVAHPELRGHQDLGTLLLGVLCHARKFGEVLQKAFCRGGAPYSGMLVHRTNIRLGSSLMCDGNALTA
mmetsp:Transcript_54736/g.129366  ORF Transcript_54736/g.129366 Transcript_54736/m.129366 type:complete len:212 (-) Transcript_54736:41-676(-)